VLGLIVAVCAIALALAGLRRHRDLASPYVLFSVGWLFPWALSELALSSAQSPLTAGTIRLLVEASISFLLGMAALAPLVAPDRPLFSLTDWRLGFDRTRLRRATYLIAILSTFGLAFEAAVAGTLPILAPQEISTVVYRHFALPFVHYLTISFIVVALLGATELRTFGIRGGRFAVALVIVSTLAIVALLARQQVVLIALGVGLLVHYTRRGGIPISWIVISGTVALALFVVAAANRGLSSEQAAELTGTSMPTMLAPLVLPYLYLTLNFTVLQFMTESHLPATLGANVFEPLLSLTLTRRLVPIPNVEEEFGWFNTYTFVWPIYSDFREIGVIVVPFFYGLLTMWLYVRMRRDGTPTALFLYALAAFVVGFLFQSNGYGFTPLYVFAAEIVWAMWYAKRRTAIEPP